MDVQAAAFSKVPYLRSCDLGGRIVQLMPLWEDGRWTMWIPGPHGDFIEMHPKELCSGHYLAKLPAVETDLHLPFMEFMWQRTSWRETLSSVSAIADDINNLATALAKIDVFWQNRVVLGSGIGLGEFVRTDVEYVLVVARSVLDHLHEVVRFLWGTVRLHDPEAQRRKKRCELPQKLSKTVLPGGELCKADEMSARYGLLPSLSEFYARLAPFVRDVRLMRDAVVHKGQSGRSIYVLENGFGISRDDRLYNSISHIWTEAHKFNEALVSLRPLLAHVVLNVLYACNAAMEAGARHVEFPTELAPGYHVFLRAEHGAALIRVQAVLRGGSPWWEGTAASNGS